MMHRLRGGRAMALVAAMALVLALSATVAFAAIRVGTDGVDNLVGTSGDDIFNGKGGNDTTNGKGGNDAYRYQDGWGEDTVLDSAGSDTLDFSRVDDPMEALLCPGQTADIGNGDQPLGFATDGTNTVEFSPPTNIEGVIGSGGGSELIGCGADDRLLAANGNDEEDIMVDIGGIEGDAGLGIEAPRKSTDVYGGFGGDHGVDIVLDGRGPGDTANFRSRNSNSVEFFRGDSGLGLGGEDLIVITSGDIEDPNPTAVVIASHFDGTFTDDGATLNAKIEKFRFSNTTLTAAQVASQAEEFPFAASTSLASEGGESSVGNIEELLGD